MVDLHFVVVVVFVVAVVAARPNLSSHLAARDVAKVLLRKCCAVDEVYHIDDDGSGGGCVARRPTPTPTTDGASFAEISRRLSFPGRTLDDADADVVTGMPADCPPRNIIRLEPDVVFGDRFFPDAAGRLVIPHRYPPHTHPKPTKSLENPIKPLKTQYISIKLSKTQ